MEITIFRGGCGRRLSQCVLRRTREYFVALVCVFASALAVGSKMCRLRLAAKRLAKSLQSTITSGGVLRDRARAGQTGSPHTHRDRRRRRAGARAQASTHYQHMRAFIWRICHQRTQYHGHEHEHTQAHTQKRQLLVSFNTSSSSSASSSSSSCSESRNIACERI